MPTPETDASICRACAFPADNHDGTWVCRACGWIGTSPHHVSVPGWLQDIAGEVGDGVAGEVEGPVVAWPDPRCGPAMPRSVRLRWRGHVVGHSVEEGDEPDWIVEAVTSVLTRLEKEREAKKGERPGNRPAPPRRG